MHAINTEQGEKKMFIHHVFIFWGGWKSRNLQLWKTFKFILRVESNIILHTLTYQTKLMIVKKKCPTM